MLLLKFHTNAVFIHTWWNRDKKNKKNKQDEQDKQDVFLIFISFILCIPVDVFFLFLYLSYLSCASLLMSFSPSHIADGLKVEHFGYIKEWRQAAAGRAQANDGREIAHAPVQFSQQHGGDEVQLGWVDQDRLILPLLG